MNDQTVDHTISVSQNTGLYRQQSVLHKQGYNDGAPHLAPPLSGWVVCAVCLVILIFFILFLSFAKYTHREKVSGELQPESGVIEISSPDEGIVKQISVDDGAYVFKGQILAVVQKNKLGSDLVSKSDNEKTTYLLQIKNLQNNISNISMQVTEKYREHLKHVDLIRKKLINIQNQIILNKQLLSKQQILVEKLAELESVSAVSNLESQIQTEKLTHLKDNNEQLNNEILTLNQELVSINHQYTQFSLNSDVEKISLEREILQFTQLIKSSQIDNTFTITAPQDGQILAIKTLEGQFVKKNVPLLFFTTRNQTLIAQLQVPDRAIPFIKLEDTVNLRYNPFPYQKFGQYQGKIKSISSIPIDTASHFAPDSKHLNYYKVTLALDQQDLMINNNLYALKPGYTLEAELVTESRTLFSWIFYKFFDG